MIIILRKKSLIGLALAVMGCSLLFAGALRSWQKLSQPAAATAVKASTILVWDAGHGGADGGAVSAEGVPESGINLAIARRGYLLSLLCGQRAAMTRRDEGSLASSREESIRRQKQSDTQNRLALVNGMENAVFLSIHQNCLPTSPKTHGAMVFYNAVAPADAIGGAVQEALNGTVNPGNEKQCRAMGENVYLMKHIRCPGVLVECGFLSNSQEAQQLQEGSYQTLLACCILSGYFTYQG